MAAYTELSRTEYSWEELQVRPLPPGVDPAKIETYLNDTVFRVSFSAREFVSNSVLKYFQEKFKMTKSEFQACPRWKQVEMKKVSGLF